MEQQRKADLADRIAARASNNSGKILPGAKSSS